MNRATPAMRNFARRLAALERRAQKPSEARLPAAFVVCEKLRPSLAALMGHAGFRALVSRAHTLALAEVPRLRTVHVNAEGALKGWDELPGPLNADEISEGGVVLLAHLLDLLVAFIGQGLTVRLVSEVWPNLSVSDLELESESTHEKAN